MTWVAVGVGFGSAVVGGIASNRAAGKAASAQNAGNNAAIAEQRRQYDQTRTDMMPWLTAGQGEGGLAGLAKLNAGDYSGFMDSPDYLWARDQGIQGLDRSAARNGGLFSGGQQADLMRFNQGLATQTLGNYRASLQSMAGLGQTSAQNLGAFGANSATGIGNLLSQNGANRASAYQTQGNNWGQLAGIAGNALNQGYAYNRTQNPGGTGWYVGNNPGRG